MRDVLGSDWGYKILSPYSFNFYHRLLQKVDLRDIARQIQGFKEISVLPDGSINVYTDSLAPAIADIQKIARTLEKDYSLTQDYPYAFSKKKTVKSWTPAILASLGMLIAAKSFSLSHRSSEWGLIGKGIDGIFIKNYTVVVYENYAKVIHPIRVDNLELRENIEREISSIVNGISKRIDEAAVGYEGQGLLSYVEEKSELRGEEIVKIISDKVFEAKA